MPGNIYGVAFPAVHAVQQAGTTTSLVAGTETVFITNANIGAVTQGNWYVMAFCTAIILMGATAPTALKFALTLNGGSDNQTYTVNPNTLVASTYQTYSFVICSNSSATVFWPSVVTVAITGLASTTAATSQAAGTQAQFLLCRSADSYV